jgi:hypothetical protein
MHGLSSTRVDEHQLTHENQLDSHNTCLPLEIDHLNERRRIIIGILQRYMITMSIDSIEEEERRGRRITAER